MVRARNPPLKAAKEDTDVYRSKDELPEHLKERYAVLLEDYDRQVAQKIQDLRNKAQAEADKVYNHFILQMMKLPKSVKAMKWEEVLAMARESHSEQEQAAKGDVDLDEEVRRMKAKIDSDVRSAIKKAPPRKRRPPPPSTGATRRSSRKRTVPGPYDETVLTSTANTTRSRARGFKGAIGCDISMVAPGNPPLITPKVNGVTPFFAKGAAGPGSVVRRMAKSNETTFSINGSPVFTGVSAAGGKRTAARGGSRKTAGGPAAMVRLGGGRELVLASLDDDGDGAGGIELDKESRAKVLAVKNQLDKLLQMRGKD